MQEMFRPTRFSSKDTITEAEIDFCPTAMEGALSSLRKTGPNRAPYTWLNNSARGLGSDRDRRTDSYQGPGFSRAGKDLK